MHDVAPENIFGPFTWNNVLLWLLALAGLVSVVGFVVSSIDAAGLLPPWLARWIARNRFGETLKALERLNVRTRWDDERQSILNLLMSRLETPSYLGVLQTMLAKETYTGEIQIGEGRLFTSQGFIDVIGATTRQTAAQQYAQILNTFRLEKGIVDFDLVACPKSGSPILGYEFSRLTEKQLILGKPPGTSAKIKDPYNILGAHIELDFPRDVSLQGKRILLVDDSTTGGSKMLSLVKSLRAAGATVHLALVLFEPQGKDARKSLEKEEVRLFSVMSGPKGN